MAVYDPSVTPALTVWFEPSIAASTFTDGTAGVIGTTGAVDTNSVQTMRDLSGNGRIAYSSTNKPVLAIAASHFPVASLIFNSATPTLMNWGKPADMENLAYAGYTIVITAYLTNVVLGYLLSKGVSGGDAANALVISAGIFERYFSGTPLSGTGYPPSPAQVGVGSKHIFAYRFTPIASGSSTAPIVKEELFVDGRLVLSRRTQAPQWLSSGNWCIGSNDSSVYTLSGEIASVIMYARAIADVEIQQVFSYCASKFLIPCYTPQEQPHQDQITGNMFLVGNSLTYGVTGATTPVNSYPTQMERLLTGYSLQYWNLGISGVPTASLITFAPNREFLLYDPKRKNYILFWEITNDWALTNITAAQAYANVVAYCTAAKAAMPNTPILVGTCIVRGGSFTNTNITSAGGLAAQQAAFEVGRLSINASILAAKAANATWLDGVVDFGNGGMVTIFGTVVDTSPLGDYTNGANFSADKIHLLQGSYKLVGTMAQLATAQILATQTSGQLFGGDVASIAAAVPNATQITAAVPSTASIAAAVPNIAQITAAVPNIAQITAAVPSTAQIIAAMDASVIDGGLTRKQTGALQASIDHNLYSSTLNGSTGVVTTQYFAPSGTTLYATSVWTPQNGAANATRAWSYTLALTTL